MATDERRLTTEMRLARLGAGDFNLWGALELPVLQAMVDADVKVKPEQQRIIVLCGSTRFKAQWTNVQLMLAAVGHVPIIVEFYHHDIGVNISLQTKRHLDDLHKRKIDISDGVFIVNHQGYVGESTLSELLYAHALGKPIGWLHPEQKLNVTLRLENNGEEL